MEYLQHALSKVENDHSKKKKRKFQWNMKYETNLSHRFDQLSKRSQIRFLKVL